MSQLRHVSWSLVAVSFWMTACEELATVQTATPPLTGVHGAPPSMIAPLLTREPTATSSTAEPVATPRLLSPDRQYPFAANAFAYSPDLGGVRIAVADGQSLIVLDQKTGETQSVIPLPALGEISFVTSIAFSPDGSHVAIGGADHWVQVWDVVNEQLVFKREGLDAVARVVYLPREGRLVLLSGGESQGMIEILDPNTGEQLAIFATLAHDISPSPLEPLLATAESTNQEDRFAVRLWSTDGMEATENLFPDEEGSASREGTSVAFSPDGEYLAVIVNGMLHVWGMASKSEMSWTKTQGFLEGWKSEGSSLIDASISSRNEVAVLNVNGFVSLVSIENGSRTASLKVPHATSLAFSPNGEHLLVGGFDSVLHEFLLSESQ